METIKSFSFFILKIFFKIYFLIFGKPKLDKTISNLTKLYEKENFTGWFATIRLWDSPFEKLNKVTSKSGRILDLGCGDGIITNYLALSGTKRKLTGIELDIERLKFANRGLKNTKFFKGDATKMKIGNFDTVVMVHLLHHLASYQAQEKLIKKLLKLLKKKGRLIIVEVDKKPSLKYLLTWFVDHFLVPWLFERKLYSTVYFRTKKDWQNLLEKQGLCCKIKSLEGGKPFTHILFECQRK